MFGRKDEDVTYDEKIAHVHPMAFFRLARRRERIPVSNIIWYEEDGRNHTLIHYKDLEGNVQIEKLARPVEDLDQYFDTVNFGNVTRN